MYTILQEAVTTIKIIAVILSPGCSFKTAIIEKLSNYEYVNNLSFICDRIFINI